MSQSRATFGLVALLLLGALGAGAYFLLVVPAPVSPVYVPTLPTPGPTPTPEVSKSPGLVPVIQPVIKEDFSAARLSGLSRDRLSIGGIVRTADGIPIEGATVDLLYDASAVTVRAQESDLRGTMATVSNGAFFFDAVTCPTCALAFSERYVLRVSHPGFATERISGVELKDPRSENRDIVLSPTGNRIMGTIRDRAGAPIAGADVRVYDLSSSSSDPDGALERVGQSAADGSYEVANLKPGLKKLWARRTGYASNGRPSLSIDPKGPESRVDLVLRQGFAILGAVMAQDTGEPIEGAYVSLKPTRLGPAMFVASAEADAKRRNFDEGNAEAIKKAKAEQIEPGVGLEDMRLRREEAMRNRGQKGGQEPESDGGSDDADANSKNGGRRENSRQRAEQDFSQQQQYMQLTVHAFRSGPDGRFKADGLEEGAYQITVSAPGYAPPPIQSAETGADGVMFNLISNARVLGQCVDDETGRAITAFTVGLGTTFDQSSVPYHMRRSFAPPKSVDGFFEYTDVRPGTYFLLAEAPGYAGGRSEQITVGQAERREGVVIRLVRGSTIVGRIVDTDGKPVADATVSLDTAVNASDPGQAFVRMFQTQMRRETKETRSERDGTFKLPNVLEGKYALKVRHPDYGPYEDTVNFDVSNSGEVRRPDVTLARGATVRGRVMTPEGSPDTAAMIQIAPVVGGAFQQKQASTDGAGRYEASGLAPGEYRIICAQRNGAIDLGSLLSQIGASRQPGGPPAPSGLPPTRTYTLSAGQVLELDF